MRAYHLTPDSGRWKLTAAHHKEPIGDFASKEEALHGCGELLRDGTGSLRIYRPDGTFDEEHFFPDCGAEKTETPSVFDTPAVRIPGIRDGLNQDGFSGEGQRQREARPGC